MEHLLCTKTDLDDRDFSRLEELTQDPQVDINYKSEEHFGRTPLMLLCSEEAARNDDRLLKCVEILLKRRGINTILKDDRGLEALTQLCRHYQGDDLNEVLRLLIRHDARDSKERFENWSTALLNLCQYHEGKSLKEAVRILVDCDTQILAAKNNNGDSILCILLGRSREQNCRFNLLKIVYFIMKRGLQWDRTKWIEEIVNGRNTIDGRNALHILCSVYNENFIELARLLKDSEGINPQQADGEGQNAMHILLSSASYNRVDNLMELVEYLLNDIGIDPKAKNNNNKDVFDILFDCCNHHEYLIDLFRLLVGPSVYTNPRDDQGSKALLPLCSSADRISELYKRFAPRLIESGKIDVNAVAYVTHADAAMETIQGLCHNYITKYDLSHLIQLLIKFGANSNFYGDHLSFSQFSEKHGCDENLIELLDRHILKVKKMGNSDAFFGSTVLHLLCQNYEEDDLIDLVRSLINKGANVNALDDNGASALHKLCQHYPGRNMKDIVQILIESKVDVTFEEKYSETVLHRLCSNKSANSLKNVCQLLIENGADVKKTVNSPNANVLHTLCKNYKGDDMFDVIKFLIEKGISVEDADEENNTALHFLCENYHGPHLQEIIQLLIGHGIDVGLANRTGSNALHALCSHFRGGGKILLEIVHIFIANRIDLTATTDSEENALHCLCQNVHQQDTNDLIRLFISNGIDVKARTYYHKYDALDFLCKRDSSTNALLPIVKLLVDQVENGTVIETESYGDRDNPLYQLLRYYEGPDALDIVKYFVVDKKIAFEREQVLEIMRKRHNRDYGNPLLQNQEEIHYILSTASQGSFPKAPVEEDAKSAPGSNQPRGAFV